MKKSKKRQIKQRKKLVARKKREQYLKLLFVFIIIIAVVWGVKAVYGSRFFDIKEIKVLNNQRISTQEILKLSGLSRNNSLLKVNAREIEDKIKENPWVRDVEVARRLPGTIELKIRERKPIMALFYNDSYYLIDKDQMILSSTPTNENMPVIKDVQVFNPEVGRQIRSERIASAILCFLRINENIRNLIVSISVSEFNELYISTKDGIDIYFGKAKSFSKKNYILDTLLTQARLNKEKIIYVDLRVISNPVVKKIRL
ncbi:MAG: FtsQ-type POTRA domain-containing protein [Actinobacteria bacterium]|nr:FtsQ-type POTRA domain-containing protein [Actinomycetota bacterium]